MFLSNIIKYSSDIFESLHEGVAIIDKNGTILYVNSADNRITGLNKSELIGKNVKEVIPYSHVPLVLKTKKKIVGVETEVNSKKVVSNIVPIVIDGVNEGAITIFRDISEVLQLSKKLDEANSTIETLFKKLNFINELDNNIVIGKSGCMENVLKLTRKASNVTSTVLIQGESGTGKEIIARLIHKYSDRSDQPFIPLNCAAIPDNLLESELFGFEEGAFTGAKKGGRPGVFELSHRGTIFLDEIGDMNVSLQSKLLRVIQNKEILRIGGTRYRKIDVRIIAATNKDLYEMVKKKTFRDDLYYRLKVINIHLPSLRERKEDIQLYIENAMNKICSEIGKKTPKITPKALKCLLEYNYPGNIRELENIIEMALVTDEDDLIDIDDLPSVLISDSLEESLDTNEKFSVAFDKFPSLSELEEHVLRVAIKRYKTKAKIARILKISRSTLYRKLEQYGLIEEIIE